MTTTTPTPKPTARQSCEVATPQLILPAVATSKFDIKMKNDTNNFIFAIAWVSFFLKP